jgi:hypothetical protein
MNCSATNHNHQYIKGSLPKDGTILYWIDSGTAVYDPGGKPYKMVGSVTDITERKKMEEDLLRSKKLESVGFLSGGIAHDFNNLLTGIMGNISLAKLSDRPGDPHKNGVASHS